MAKRPNLEAILTEDKEARLIPLGSGENAMTSVVLAAMARVRPFANAVLQSLHAREGELGQTEKFAAYTQVHFGADVGANKKSTCDGVIQTRTRRNKVWTAIVESKTGSGQNADIDPIQMARYIRVAKHYRVDCIITLSNQLVVDPKHIPYKPEWPDGKKPQIELLHTSWANLRTLAQMLLMSEGEVEDEAKYVLREMAHYMDNNPKLVVHFGNMKSPWKSLVSAAKSGENWAPATDDVEQAIRSWQEAERHLSLMLSKLTSKQVVIGDSKLSQARRNTMIRQRLTGSRQLSSTLGVTNGPGEFTVVADLNSLVLSARATIPAPDEGTARSRIEWLTKKQLGARRRAKQHEKSRTAVLDYGRRDIRVRANYARQGSRRPVVAEATLAQAIENRKVLELEDAGLDLKTFEIEMQSERDQGLGAPSKFPALLEKFVVSFYDGVYQHIDKWMEGTPRVQPNPDATVEPTDSSEDTSRAPTAETAHASTLKEG